jgi:DNA-binding Lrp family transcriptional regulator
MLNKKDIQILSHLRQNSRQTLTTMSKHTKIPISTLYDRLKLHEGGVIQRFTSLIDFGSLGYSTRANLMLKVSRESREGLKGFLLAHYNVNCLFKLNNEFDFMVEAVFRSIKELEAFKEVLEHRFAVESLQLFYVVEDLKREGFLSDPQLNAVLN